MPIQEPRELTITVFADNSISATLIVDGEYSEDYYDPVTSEEIPSTISDIEHETGLTATVFYEEH